MISVPIKKLIKGFYYASDGITYALWAERNMKIHFFISIVSLFLGLWLHLQPQDAVVILLSIGLVLAAELINTSLEKVVDLVTTESHPFAKIAKDTAAGSVLILVFVVIAVGIVTFFPYFQLVQEEWSIINVHPPSFFALAGVLQLMLTYLTKACYYQKNKQNAPHVLLGILIFFYALLLLHHLIFSYLLLLGILILISYLLKKKRFSLIGLVYNWGISFVGFFLVYFLLY